MNETNVGSIYPLYSNDYLVRPISVFDIVTDPNIYNQNICLKGHCIQLMHPYLSYFLHQNNLYLSDNLFLGRLTYF